MTAPASRPEVPPEVPRLPRWNRELRGAPGQRVSLSGFLIAPTIEIADRISELVAGHVACCLAARGCMRAEIWRSRSDPMRFAIFLRFRSRDDWEELRLTLRGGAWEQATAHLSEGLRLYPE